MARTEALQNNKSRLSLRESTCFRGAKADFGGNLLFCTAGDSGDGILDTGNASDGFTGFCSLRAATITANYVSGSDTIAFNIPGDAIPTINLASDADQFRTVTDPVIIDGTTQPGGWVELNGAAIDGDGLVFRHSASGSEIHGLVFNRFRDIAIVITADDMLVTGNRIGTDASGTVTDPDGVSASGDELGNRVGIVVGADGTTGNTAGGHRNRIGGTTTAERNVISGNTSEGILIVAPEDAANVIQGNYIGTDITGTVSLSRGQGTGVFVGIIGVTSSRGNSIGGTVPGAGNQISGNRVGIFIGGHDNDAQGNLIGTDVTGTQPLGNADAGVLIAGSGNRIGGTPPTARNVISSNSIGVRIAGQANVEHPTSTGNMVEGNLIGTDITGTLKRGNQTGIEIANAAANVIGGATGNLIFGNVLDGVVLTVFSSLPDQPVNTTDNLVLGNRVIGNYIGVASDGATRLGNQGNGVFVFRAPSNEIGGSAPGEGNVISTNEQAGVLIQGATAEHNVVLGNQIGTDWSGLLIDPDGVPDSGDELGNRNSHARR